MGVIKEAVSDAVITFLFVSIMPFLGVVSSVIIGYMGAEVKSISGLFITINMAALFMLAFSLVGAAMGDASFNPSATLSLYTAGLKPDMSLSSMIVRFPAQAAGGVAGAKAILQVMPKQYKHVLKGPSLKVNLHTGAMAEGVLTFVLCFNLLFILLKGPKNMLVKIWLLAVGTMCLVITGGKYTGPSMNPANAYGWAYVNNWHNTWELFYVYWICPFIGGVSAALVFGFLFKKPEVKEKKA